MTHLLDDCWALVGRAEKQFDALQAEVVQFFNDNPATLIIEDDPQTREKVVYFNQEPKLPRDWGIDVGQLVNNARTALDHLIYALAVKGGGNPEADKTAFPIFEDRDKYWQVRGRGTRETTVRDQYLAGVNEEWRKKVDAIQPYHQRDRAWQDRLAVLSEIANWHKHKTLKAARITIETPAHICFATSGLTSEILVRYDPRRHDHVSVQAKMQAAQSLSNPGVVLIPKMQMDGGVQAGLVFGDPPRFYTLGDIKGAVSYTRSVIKWFQPAFNP